MTWTILNLDGNVPCDMSRFAKLAISLEKTEEQYFMRDVGRSLRERILKKRRLIDEMKDLSKSK